MSKVIYLSPIYCDQKIHEGLIAILEAVKQAQNIDEE